MNTIPIDDLVRQSQEGDMEAFDALVGHYYGMVYRISYRMLNSKELAEDATQEVFIKAWRNLSHFKNASRFTTWLHSITANHCRDLARRRQRESSRRTDLYRSNDESQEDDWEKLIETWRKPEERLTTWDLCLALQEALERLPEDLRVVILLHFLADRSVEEIAVMLKLHPNSIYARLSRAVERLKRQLIDRETRR